MCVCPEDHLDMTPVEYVMWRYRGGVDKEMAKKDANTMTEEELKALRQKAKEEKSGVVEVSSIVYVCMTGGRRPDVCMYVGAAVSPHGQERARVRGEVGGTAQGEQLAHPHRAQGNVSIHTYILMYISSTNACMYVCVRGYEKMVNQKDEQIAMESMLGQRKLTTGQTRPNLTLLLDDGMRRDMYVCMCG